MAIDSRQHDSSGDAVDGAAPRASLTGAADHDNTGKIADKEEKPKLPLNLVFLGHADAGKSTVAAQILCLSGQVDEKTIQKYQKEAKDKSLESWYMAYIMDMNEEDRLKGMTGKAGRTPFETDVRRFSIMDALDCESCVPTMISAACEADIGILIISARKGEFESRYQRKQMCEHALLANTVGVAKLIVAINKMDEPTVQWSEERYHEIEGKMAPLLENSGYNLEKDVYILPISGLCGTNMKIRMDKSVCSWWSGPCLFELLDKIALHHHKGPVRMPLTEINMYEDSDAVVFGKLESGIIRIGDTLLVMPNKASVKVTGLGLNGKRVSCVGAVERICVKLSGVHEEDVMAGFVLSSVANHVGAFTEFNAQLQISELLDNATFTTGYKAMLHVHSFVEECEVVDLIEEIDINKKKGSDPNKKKRKRSPPFVKNGAVVVCRIQVNNLVSIEKCSDFQELGRFTLQKEGKIVAAGKVVDVPPTGSCWEDDDDDKDIITLFQISQDASKLYFDQVFKHASSLEKEVTKLRSEKEILIKSESELTKRVDTLQRNHVELKKELKKQQNQVDVITEEKKTTFDRCMKQLEGMREEMNGYWKTVSEVESRALTAEAKCSDMEAKYKQVVVSNKVVLEKMELLKAESEVSKRRLEEERLDLRNKLTEMEKSNEMKLKQAACVIEAKDKDIAALMNKNSALSVELSQKKKWIANCETELASVNDVLDEQRKCWTNMQDNCELQGIMQSQAVNDLTNVCTKLSTLGKGVAQKTNSTKGLDKPKKPPSAFLLFMEDFKRMYKQKGDMTASKAGTEKWRAMSDVDKAPYYAAYDNVRVEHPEKSAYNLRHGKPP